MKKNILTAKAILTLAFCSSIFINAQNTFPATGGVGIGTTTPDGLQINQSLSSENTKNIDNVRIGTLAGSPRIIFDDMGYTPYQLDNNLGSFRIFQSGMIRLNIDPNGKIGIGNANPTANLDVLGQGLFSRSGMAECCSNGNYTLALAEATSTNGKKSSISFHNAGIDEGSIELSRERDFRAIKFYDHQNNGLGIDVRGRGIFSRDNMSECCSNKNYTLSIAENTAVTGNTAKIQFHNSGRHEGYIELASEPGGENRRLRLGDHQGYGLGLEVTGKVSIGTNNKPTDIGGANITSYKLFVKGGILADEVRVRTGWADYVFADEYRLKPLAEVESFIKKNKHLPNVPTSKEVESQGINVGNIAKIQQEKIEELTLYIIDQNKRIEKLESQIEKLVIKK
jgi:hypothetical protein